MKIKSMRASFGKLSGEEIQLGDKFNIIEAKNEAGKSTWCEFIRAMLYGVSTSERDKIGYLSAKTKYRPWSGSAMEGTMEIETGGTDVTISRSAHGQSPMKKFTAVYSGTGLEYPNLNGEDAGETLTGVSETVFARTAFIRRADLKVSQSYELEKRVSSLISTGDEQTSFTEADEKLRAWQRARRYHSRGTLPELENMISAAETRLEEIENANESLSDIREEMLRLQAHAAELEEDLTLFGRLEKKERQNKLVDAKRRIEILELDRANLAADIDRAGGAISAEEIAEIRAQLAGLQSLSDVLKNAQEAQAQAQKAQQDAAEKKFACALSKMSREKLASERTRLAELKKAADEPRTVKKNPLPPVILLVLAAVFAALGAAVLSGAVMFIAFGAAAVCAVLAIVLFAKKPAEDTGAKDEFESALSGIGFKSLEDFEAAAAEYEELISAEDEATAAEAAVKHSCENARRTAEENTDAIFKTVQTYRKDVTGIREALLAVKDAEEQNARLAKIDADLSLARSLYSEIRSEYAGDEPETADLSLLRRPLRDREGTLSALADTKAKLERVSRDYNQSLGEIRTMGDPSVLQTEIVSLKSAHEKAAAEHDALALAIETLKESSAEMQTRFSPIISKTAGEYMSKMTGGKYDSVTFDKEFDAQAKTGDETVGHSALYLSSGTFDQLYLSLRLAMCELLLDGEEPCPIILDDALISFDSERMAAALTLLREISEKRQVILFTCHDRESKWLSENS